jgi:hypothetical protein
MKTHPSKESIFDSSLEGYGRCITEPQFTNVRQYIWHQMNQWVSSDRGSQQLVESVTNTETNGVPVLQSKQL